MPPTGEWFERQAGGFHPLTNAAVAEDVDLDPTRLECPCDRQLRWNVAAAVHDDEQNLHRASPSAATEYVAAPARIASDMSRIRSWTSSTDSPRSSRRSFQL